MEPIPVRRVLPKQSVVAGYCVAAVVAVTVLALIIAYAVLSALLTVAQAVAAFVWPLFVDKPGLVVFVAVMACGALVMWWGRDD